MASKRNFWIKHYQQWQSSGMSQVAYCKQQEISHAAFCWWRAKLRKRGDIQSTHAQAVNESQAFVPIKSTAQVPAPVIKPNVSLELPGGMMLRINWSGQ